MQVTAKLTSFPSFLKGRTYISTSISYHDWFPDTECVGEADTMNYIDRCPKMRFLPSSRSRPIANVHPQQNTDIRKNNGSNIISET
jgi:hypothetical protein